MELIEIIKKAQSNFIDERTLYCRKLFDIYKDFIIRQFAIYSPYTDQQEKQNFVTSLTCDFFQIIKHRFSNFKLKKQYLQEEPEVHLLHYFKTIVDSILDRSLIRIYLKGENEKIQKAAGNYLEEKYSTLVKFLIADRVKNCETSATRQLDGFALEEYWDEEIQKLFSRFFKDKFHKIIDYFEKDNSNAIFRNYVEKAVRNFLMDYLRSRRVKIMRRLVLYKDDLPGKLFETLQNLEGHGNLFYYKKKQDCLSIRDINKAISVIKGLDMPDQFIKNIDLIFWKSRKSAEYQRIIDNILAYLARECRDPKCANKLTRRIIKILLNHGDAVMKKRLSITEAEIVRAGSQLERCVNCLGINRNDFF